jgi:predicted extracellular nuclease
VRLKRFIPLLAVIGLLAAAGTASATSPSGVLISQLRLRTSASQFDQYVQIANTTSAPVDISGYQLFDCFGTGGASVGNDGNPLPAGTTLPANTSFVFGKDGGDYTGVSDATYNFAIRETGGVELRNASGSVLDSFGAPGTPCAEPTGVILPTTGTDFTITRKMAGGIFQDTDDNAADFNAPSGQADGTPCGAACAAAPVPTAIDQIEGPGDASPLAGDKVQITGTVVGVDNQQDVSNFVDLEPTTAGIFVETPTDQQDDDPNTSEGIFVGGLPPADRVATEIGQTVTVSGTVEEMFGLTTLDATGSEPTFTGLSSTKSLPAPVVIDPARPAAQTVSQGGSGNPETGTRPYYETLEGMRVELKEGTANSGGTDKFGELYLDPGTKTGVNLASENTPIGPPDLLDVGQDAGSADVDPTNPSAEPPSSTRVNANLHDHVENVIGPLGFDFDDYEIYPQPGTPPKVIHDGVQFPPAAPEPQAGTMRVANFNMENLFGAGMVDDGHTFTQAEVNQKTTQLANAINLMHDPDVIADEEVASFKAYKEVAAKLGDYTAVWKKSNDLRHIAVGFLVKNGVSILGVTQLGKNATTTVSGCQDNAGEGPVLFERPPLAITVQDGGLTMTLIGNHLASLGHPEGCREAQADFLAQQTAQMEAAGQHVIVIGDLNDYQDSPALTQNLLAHNSLQDLWFRAPENSRYSFQFDGQLETLDHIFVDNFLSPLVKQIRYVHFDNNYAAVTDPSSPIGVSDHDPPVAVIRVPKH